MASFNKIKAGDVLWEVRSERAGNTTMRRVAVRPVVVASVDAVSRTAMCHWNGTFNPATRYTERMLKPLRVKKPEKK